MPVTAITRFYAWLPRKRRHHGGSFTDLITPEPYSVFNGGGGETFNAGFAPSELPVPGSNPVQKVKFAFWSVAGGADGGQVGAPAQALAPSVNVGTANITATAWYLPHGGSNGGGTGVWIDAFDVNQGMFVDDDFVNVTSNPALTTTANNDGWVPSDTAQAVEAYPFIHFTPFMQWSLADGTEPVNNTTLSVAAGTNATAFAFYRSEGGIPYRPKDSRELSVWYILFGIINDAPGVEWHPGEPPHPIGPWGPEIIKLLTQATYASYSSKLKGDLKIRVLNDIIAKARDLSARMNGKR